DDQAAWLLADQRADHAARRTARAEQQHARAVQHDAVVHAQVAHQTKAVRVVAVHALLVETQCVDRTGCLRARRATRGVTERRFLEWHRDVESTPAGRAKSLYRWHKTIQRREQALIGQRLPSLVSEFGVNVG